VTAQEDALAALSRLQQLTQLTIGWPFILGVGASLSSAAIRLQHMPEGLQSLDLTCCEGWDTENRDALAPLARLQQLTELRIGKVQPEQLGQLPPALQQLDVSLLVGADLEHHIRAAAWYQQHAGIVRRLVLDGGKPDLRWYDLKRYLEDGWAYVIEAMPEAFDAVATAAAGSEADSALPPAVCAVSTATQAPAPQQTFISAPTSSSSSSSSSSSGKYPLQSLQVVHMPWLLDGKTLGSLPVSSLTELECSLDSGCERLVASLSSLTALNSLRIAFTRSKDDYCNSLVDLPDSAFAPLSALLQLTQLQLGHVRAQQLAHLQLPQLQQLRAIVARVDMWQDDQAQQPFDVSHLSSLTLLHINSSWVHGDGFPSSLRAVTWEFPTEVDFEPDVADRLSSAEMNLQPLLQLGALEMVHFIFYDLQPAQILHGLLHELVTAGEYGKHVVWRMAARAAERGVVGNVQPAAAAGGGVQSGAAEASWGAAPLKSVRLMYDKLHHGFASMPASTVQAFGALQLTVLAIHGGNRLHIHLGLEVTPAQLGAVLQRLPLLRILELAYFALLCDEAAAADASVQTDSLSAAQQHDMQPNHSAAGVISLVSAIRQLPKLQTLCVEVPLQLQQATASQVAAALEQLLPSIKLRDTTHSSLPPAFILSSTVRVRGA
jgi:hypothetical protein